MRYLFKDHVCVRLLSNLLDQVICSIAHLFSRIPHYVTNPPGAFFKLVFISLILLVLFQELKPRIALPCCYYYHRYVSHPNPIAYTYR